MFCNLIFDFCVKTGTRFSLRDKRLFEITEVEITRVNCIIVVCCTDCMYSYKLYGFGNNVIIFISKNINFQTSDAPVG